MPIKLNVPFKDKDEAKVLGAWWNAKEKLWTIPDHISDINPFIKWLPKEEGYLVHPPIAVFGAERNCWKCGQSTPLIALGAKNYHYLFWSTNDHAEWIYTRDYTLLFHEIDILDLDMAAELHQHYPFFKLCFSKNLKAECWANTCLHCGQLQGDNYNFRYGGPYSLEDEYDTKAIKKNFVQLDFSYYISCGSVEMQAYQYLL